MCKIRDCKYRKITNGGAICLSPDRLKALDKNVIICPFDDEQDSTACFDWEPREELEDECLANFI